VFPPYFIVTRNFSTVTKLELPSHTATKACCVRE
jgi:hypothetical protein